MTEPEGITIATVHPILITGAPRRVGGVGGAIVEALRRRGLPVRALVRREDERSRLQQSLLASLNGSLAR